MMATTEQNALIRAKDAQGNSSIIYPITKAENVDGLDEDIAAALASAKTYADSAATTAANSVKNDLLNGAGAAYDTLKELGDLIDDNTDAIEALETVAAGKANKDHTHTISDVTDLQTTLDGKMSSTDPVATGSFSMGRKAGTTIGSHSHAEGYNTTASGYYSHAEGYNTTASGYYSHAEGRNTTASGHYSHAEGCNTTASGSWSHVQGRYNIEDTKSKYVHIVGNGSYEDDIIACSNAHTLDWDGNAWYAGTLKLGGTSYDDASEVALKSELTNKANASHNHDSSYDAKGAADTALASAKSYADTGLSAKMDSTNPVGSGTFSFGRSASTTTGQRSIVLGSDAEASGKDSVVIGRKGKSTGNYAVSIGYGNTVSGDNGISIGVNSTASSGNSITIGSGNTSSGWDAIALGRACTASGSEATTMGMSTTASGYASLSTGYYTEAAGGAQTVLGSLNIVDDAPGDDTVKSKHLVIVGNGDPEAETETRSNAHTLDWDGNAWFAGDVYVGGTSQEDGDRLVRSSELGPVTTSGTGAAYTATIDGITELTAGISFIMIPNVVSTTTTPTLNLNGLGAKYIRRRLSSATGTTVAGSAASWITANKPVRVVYDGTFWLIDVARPSGSDIYGTVPISAGGTGASSVSGALTNLGLSTETWTFTLEDGSTVTKKVYVG